MNIPEIYIKMCDCPEIQEQREKFEDGDLLASYRKEWKAVDKDTQKAVRKFDGMVIYHEGITHIADRELVIWLPYQHQIQKMIYPHKDGVAYLTAELYFWLQKPRDYQPQSMEELWLVFYMHKKHSKIWDGGKWVKKK